MDDPNVENRERTANIENLWMESWATSTGWLGA